MLHSIFCLLLIMNTLFIVYKLASLHRFFLLNRCLLDKTFTESDPKYRKEEANTQDFWVSLAEVVLVIWLAVVNWNTALYWVFVGVTIVCSKMMSRIIKNPNKNSVYKSRIWKFTYIFNEVTCSVYYTYVMYSIGLLVKFVK